MPTPDRIEIVPTWGAIANITKMLIRGGDVDVGLKMWPEIARACAMAQALTALHKSGSFTTEQLRIVQETMAAELAAQGVRK